MSEAAGEPEIQRADPAWRRLVLLSFPVLLLLGLGLFYWLQTELAAAQDLAEQSLPDGAERLIAVSMTAFRAMTATLTLIALFLATFAMRVLRHRQYPPPGAKVSRDTRILRGATARRHAWMLLAIAACVPVAMILMTRTAERKLRERLELALLAPRVQTYYPAEEKP